MADAMPLLTCRDPIAVILQFPLILGTCGTDGNVARPRHVAHVLYGGFCCISLPVQALAGKPAPPLVELQAGAINAGGGVRNAGGGE